MNRRNAKWILTVISVAAVGVLGSPISTASALASSVPTIEDESATNVTATNATLEAQIDPGGLTTEFQFGLETGCGVVGPPIGGTCQWIASISVPPGQIPASQGVQSVSVDLNAKGVELRRDALYRYGIRATNSAGPAAEIPAQYFKTLGPTAPVSIGAEWASNVSEHDAKLNALIDPNGGVTDYFFKIYPGASYNYTYLDCPWGSCDAISAGPPLPPGLREPPYEHLPSVFGDQHVSLDMASIGATLQSGTTYHFEVAATNRNEGPSGLYGSDQTFTTAGVGPDSKGEGEATAQPTEATPSNLSTGQHRQHRHRRHRRRRHQRINR